MNIHDSSLVECNEFWAEDSEVARKQYQSIFRSDSVGLEGGYCLLVVFPALLRKTTVVNDDAWHLVFACNFQGQHARLVADDDLDLAFCDEFPVDAVKNRFEVRASPGNKHSYWDHSIILLLGTRQLEVSLPSAGSAYVGAVVHSVKLDRAADYRVGVFAGGF